MTRIFFAVIAALLVSSGEPPQSPPSPSRVDLTPGHLASAPSTVVSLTQAQTVTAAALQPLSAWSCSAAPAPFDVMILLGLLAMKALTQRGPRRERLSSTKSEPALPVGSLAQPIT